MDRRVIWAIVLMMVIAIAPSLFLKKPVPRPPATADSVTGAVSEPRRPPAPDSALRPDRRAIDTATASPSAPGDTIRVHSELYTYRISTRGGRLVQASLRQYRSMAPADKGKEVDLVRPGESLLGLELVLGRDTIPLRDWSFTPSTKELPVRGPARLTLSGNQGGIGVELGFAFTPDDYQIQLSGRVSGVGPNGGLLIVDMDNGLRQTEADSSGNHHEYAVVTKENETQATRFSSLKPGDPKTLSGPFEWVAVKSKYFVTALLAFTANSRVSGVTVAAPADAGKNPTRAKVLLTMPVGPDGGFGYTIYAGPMEYHRLARLGHDFYDINPYGWPGLRTIIRPVAVGVRWLLVWMHQNLHLAYGLVLVLFGIMVRIILWPLNQKAMRASMAMQAIQPLMKEIQDRHKNDPQKLQQEMFKLYREHNVNPFGGCWPLLIPMPVLFALFFVFQNTIELRGASFLWLPDLSLKDPLFILPVLMGLSMFGLSKVGQLGMEPNPQMKMMLYLMPAMMTVLFANFASGLNLYYTVSNLASIPQQALLAKERMKRNPPKPAKPAVEVKRRK